MFDFTKAQQEAIETLDRNVSVSAGAGSGKTRVLVERFVNILRQSLRQGGKQVSAADILAITFTRKAAGEMKERVRRRLAELEQEDALHASFWQQQLELLEQARINTIHGFCNSLLKENPVEAGLDPAFQVAEEVEMDEEELMMAALDAGAEDFAVEEDSYEITTSPDDFSAVREALEAAGIPMASAEVTMIPQTYTELKSDEDIKKMNKLLDMLDDDDDVQNVYHNWDE